MASVYIPVQGTEEEVRVALDQLPHDASDILDILKAEQAPLHLWLIIAREYFKQGRIEQFRQILEEGSGPEIDEYYADVKYERIAILNALGAFHTFLGKVERAPQKEAHFKDATQYYNRASRIDETEPSTWIGKGQLCVAKGELQMASDSFKIVLDEDRNNFPALLGQASVYFLMGEAEQQHKKSLEHYRNSLDLYKRALRVYSNCPAAVRLGIAFCRYKLGLVEKARQAFQRVIQLDPQNVDALVALAIMELQTNEAGGIRRGMEKMKRAFEIYPYCTLALNHLANHYFFTGQHFVVEQLTETALSSSNNGLLKSQAYYNLARSYHSKGDIATAGRYYMASVKEISKPQDFVLPYIGLGQIQLKFGDFKSSLASFEKVLEVHPENCESLKAIGHIHVKSGDTEKAIETFKKVTRIDPKDHQAFVELGELLVETDWAAAMEYLKTARNLLKKAAEEDVPVELLNGIGLLHFEKGEFEMAEQSFKEALGNGLWVSIVDGKVGSSMVNLSVQYKEQSFFHQLEEEGVPLELHSNKVTALFNYARLQEELHDSVRASFFYRFIIFKYPDYVDAYLRLAAIAKQRNNVQLSIELIGDALKIDEKNPNALSMLGSLELQSDETWLTAKEHFRNAKEATKGDAYSLLQLGNWNYFAANRPEKKAPKFEATHREKAMELYQSQVLKKQRGNMFAANGIGILYAEKAKWDVAKELFTQVHEAASGSIFVHMPDIWINLAHVYFAQGHFQQAVKMYQNCLRKFFYNTDATILLYLARTHYEAERWQDCRKTLLRAIHLAPSNYLLRFNVGVSMQKFSASTLQKTKRTVEEVRATVTELQNAIRVFCLLSVASTYHSHGFDERKIETHVEYCKHLLNASKVHRDAAEQAEQQNKQKMEVARQIALAEEARRRAEEQRKFQLERRRAEDELMQVRQQEEHFERVKEQWKTSNHAPGKRKDRPKNDDEEGGSEKRRKGNSRRKNQKTKMSYGEEDEDKYRDEPEAEDDYANLSRENDADNSDKAPDHLLAAAGLEDSDAEDDMGHPQSAIEQKRRAWSESEDDEPLKRSAAQPSLGANDLSE